MGYQKTPPPMINMNVNIYSPKNVFLSIHDNQAHEKDFWQEQEEIRALANNKNNNSYNDDNTKYWNMCKKVY